MRLVNQHLDKRHSPRLRMFVGSYVGGDFWVTSPLNPPVPVPFVNTVRWPPLHFSRITTYMCIRVLLQVLRSFSTSLPYLSASRTCNSSQVAITTLVESAYNHSSDICQGTVVIFKIATNPTDVKYKMSYLSNNELCFN